MGTGDDGKECAPFAHVVMTTTARVVVAKHLSLVIMASIETRWRRYAISIIV